MQKSEFWGRLLFFHKSILSLQKFRKKTFIKRDWMNLEDEEKFCIFKNITFCAIDVFSFLIYAFSMQIHLFPFWWYVSNFLVLVIFSRYHYAIIHYFLKIVFFLHSFFERWIKIWLIDNRNMKNKQKQSYFFHI